MLSTDVLLGRLILAVLVVGSFVALGLWLNTTSALGWFATFVVMTLMTLIGTKLRGPRTDDRHGFRERLRGRFATLIEAIEEQPFLRWSATTMAAHVFSAMVVGIVVATAEQGVGATLFGTSSSSLGSGLIALAVVLFPTYALMAIYRSRFTYSTSLWIEKVKVGIQEAFNLEIGELRPIPRAIVGAALRTAIAVVCRVLAVLVLPAIFSNWFAVLFFAGVAIAMIVGGDTIFSLIRAVSGGSASSQPMTTMNDEEES